MKGCENMANEKFKGLSKINNWINSTIYKEARKICIDYDISWRQMLEEGLKLAIKQYSTKKEE